MYNEGAPTTYSSLYMSAHNPSSFHDNTDSKLHMQDMLLMNVSQPDGSLVSIVCSLGVFLLALFAA